MVSEFFNKSPIRPHTTKLLAEVFRKYFANAPKKKKRSNECPTQQPLANDSAYFHALKDFNLETRGKQISSGKTPQTIFSHCPASIKNYFTSFMSLTVASRSKKDLPATARALG